MSAVALLLRKAASVDHQVSPGGGNGVGVAGVVAYGQAAVARRYDRVVALARRLQIRRWPTKTTAISAYAYRGGAAVRRHALYLHSPLSSERPAGAGAPGAGEAGTRRVCSPPPPASPMSHLARRLAVAAGRLPPVVVSSCRELSTSPTSPEMYWNARLNAAGKQCGFWNSGPQHGR
jgi:hypothetical protein